MIFYLCDGEVPDCKKGGCYKNGHDCCHTSNIEHAINFKKSKTGNHYFEKGERRMKRDPPQIDFVGTLDIERLKRFLESIGYSLEKRGEGNEK